MIDFDKLWERLLNVTGCKNGAQFAAWLGVTGQAVQQAKKRRSIPKTWQQQIVAKTGIAWEKLTADETDQFSEQTENAIHMLRQWWRGKFGDDAASATNFIMELGRRFPEISGTPNQDEIIIKNAGTGWSAPQIGVLSTNEPVEGK